MSIPEQFDAMNGASDGPTQVCEMEYQRDFVLPVIEESFKTMWAAQAEAKKQRTQERKLEKKNLAL